MARAMVLSMFLNLPWYFSWAALGLALSLLPAAALVAPLGDIRATLLGDRLTPCPPLGDRLAPCPLLAGRVRAAAVASASLAKLEKRQNRQKKRNRSGV